MTTDAKPTAEGAPAAKPTGTAKRPKGRVSVGLVSDTHSHFDPFLSTAFAGCDAIIHAGDVGDEAVLTSLRAIAPLTVIRGNIDGGALFDLPLEAVLEIGGKRIGVRHICGSPKRPNGATRLFIARDRLDVIVVGHSHIPVVQRVDGAMWINPGAAGTHGFHTARYAAILHIDRDGTFAMDRVNLTPRWPGRVAGGAKSS